ncbi:Beta-1,3-glucan-binding protein [Psilocybe cubensis]|uniref:GH16 domain-containing protein n=2 Tax=Psilocybe cubensis TaxID=181762 RepID=A0A8H7XSC6_PSICU|nr:Beta-1,3-glucan-binding protein [Psilocybe cubensis]KAH9479117.1 Beta-1,3-glucan-binding protein [Psilocybe cubensis]
MAYPRRLSGTHLAPNTRARATRSSSDDDAQTGADSPSLTPPRPFFLSGDTNRSSASSTGTGGAETSSLDPPSDSDAEITIPPRAIPHHQRVHGHGRRRSGMSAAAASASAGGYAPLDNPSSPLTPAYPTSSKRRGSMTALPPGAAPPAPPAPDTPPLPPSPPTNSALFTKALPSKPPPSSFAFPFQAYPGNPDPGLSIPGLSRRRSSLDSATMSGLLPASHTYGDDGVGSGSGSFPRQGSLTDLRKPFAPFMAGSGAATPTSEGGGGNASSSSLPRSSSSNSLYKQSAAAPIAAATSGATVGAIPRNASVHSFRAPFLAPSSRPTSSLWSPPSYAHQYASMPLASPSPTASTTALPYNNNSNGTTYPPPLALVHKPKPPLPSTRLTAPIHPSEKPWLATREPRTRTSYCLTLLCVILGLAGAGLLCFTGITSVNVLDPSRLCMVLDEEFNGGSLDTAGTWNRDVELGGFGNGEFEMTTDSDDNLFLKNGELYIMPTLTSDKVNNILDGGKFTLDGCTTSNKTACSATSDASKGTVINPVQSARINTQGKKGIRFGKVEVRAKLPKGDWLWPAVWMLPTNPTYGAWPLSGEIDILEARGNSPAYPAQGSNFIRSSLNYGPFPALTHTIFGWFSLKRGDFAKEWHVYTLEWTESFIRMSVDRTTHTMLEISTRPRGPSFSLSTAPKASEKRSYWNQAGFPQTARNGSAAVVAVTNPYEGVDGATPAAPFDREFYLVVDLAAGGTSGWFPDGKGGKMWLDGSLTAMRDFARAQDTWAATWPSSPEDRAFRIDYIKMWEVCR